VAGSYVSYLAWVVSVWLISDWRPGRGQASWAEWRRLARFGFPLVLGFVGAKGQQMIESIVVGRGLSTAALGYYRYGLRISRVPVDAIIEIVATALFPAFSRIAGDRERMRATYLRALTGVTLFSSAIAGLIIALGEPGVVVLLGEPWRGAGAAVVAMAGLGLGKGFTSVSEEAIKGNGRTGLLNWLTALEFVLGVGLLVLIIPFGLFGVGLAISITALSVGALTLFLARPVVGASYRDLQVAILPALVAAAAATAVTFVLEHMVVHSDAHAMVAGVALLVFDTLVFLFVYVDVLLVLQPAVVLALMARVRSRLAR
jgi:PST family polysaccharide transporter